jgi:hypothetical protein
MGRGAQFGGTKVLRMRLHPNSATAIALQMSDGRQIVSAGKRKRDSPKRIAFVEVMKSTP